MIRDVTEHVTLDGRLKSAPDVWPHGIDQVRALYGDPSPFRSADGSVSRHWPESILTMLDLPASLLYVGRPVHRVSCHRLVAPSLARILARIFEAGESAWSSLSPYGGCYCWRLQRGSGEHLSLHSWGIALDVGVSRNPRGQDRPDFHPAVPSAFLAEGWTWGLYFGTPDPMHFQAAQGC